MKDSDAKLARAVEHALRDLRLAVKQAEAAGLKTHIYMPEGDGGESLAEGYIEVSRIYCGEETE